MERYRQIVELSDDCIKEIDRDGVVTTVNVKGLRLLGACEASQIVGKAWSALWPDAAKPVVEGAVAAALRGEPSVFDAPCPNFRGELRDWHVRVSPMHEAGRVVGVLAVSSDVTARNAAVAAAGMLRSSLHAQNEQNQKTLDAASRREASLENDLRSSASQLLANQQAYHALEAKHFQANQGRDFALAAQHAAEVIADQAQKGEVVGQLLAGVVHDLNNFLQSAISAIDIVTASGELGPRNSKLLQVAEFALQQGTEMSQRLIGFAREHPYRPETVKLAELIQKMSPLLVHAASTKVTLVVDTCDPACCAMVDRNTLERALLNLVVNARDACAPGDQVRIETGSLTVRPEDAGAQRSAGDYVTISVSDTGPGMSEEVVARVFEVYFTTKPPGAGSGLGLPQVHSAVRQAGGFVTVTSAPGKGARFELALPRVTLE